MFSQWHNKPVVGESPVERSQAATECLELRTNPLLSYTQSTNNKHLLLCDRDSRVREICPVILHSIAVAESRTQDNTLVMVSIGQLIITIWWII